MADTEDLIDFNVIETQKENIQSLPGGRSAKSLSLLCSPIGIEKSINLSETQNAKLAFRQGFEQELANIADADDPLDIYDRYIKWTTDAYPSAQATPESNLLPLLERATKAFLTTSHYKNDVRYLKMWLLYIRLFSDAPRETYAFLAKHKIGDQLALFYEEFAAWLEQAGRWTQAEEVYATAIEQEARPTERLVRKYAEFQHRRETKSQTDSDGPSSPALPKIRPALAAKIDPFASASTPEREDPQARDRATASRPVKSGKSKLAIFADGEDDQPKALGAGGPQGWDSIGSIRDRKKENTHEARPWAGEKLNGGKKLGGPKMMVFKDEASTSKNEKASSRYSAFADRCTVNPKTGRKECVFVDLESIYPTGDDMSGVEFCFEELKARRMGWLDIDWSKQQMTNPGQQRPGSSDSKQSDNSLSRKKGPSSPMGELAQSLQKLVPLKDENGRPMEPPSKTVKKSRRADRENRTRKIRVMEVRAETQTIQTNLTSPSGPKLKRKKSAEPTMTFHTKEAMNEVYDIFNQTLTKVPDEEEPAESDDDSEDDYTSAGESTGTGRISGHTSEYETDGEYTSKTTTDVTSGGITAPSGFSAFSAAKSGDDGRLSGEDDITRSTTQDLSVKSNFQGELITPTSPDQPNPLDSAIPLEDEPDEWISQPPQRSRSHKGLNRLPFMTPIVEKTESSLGALTQAAERETLAFKTPSRQNKPDGWPWSSPFEDVTQDDKENPASKITQPALPKLAKPKAPLGESKSHISHSRNTSSSSVSKEKSAAPKGPIIKDAQCNPLDETIRNTILTQIQPPLKTYAGYVDHGNQPSGRSTEIKKYARQYSKAAKGGDKTTTSILMPPVLGFPGASRTYTVRKELGRGAFAPVYLVDSETTSSDDDAEDEKKSKMGEGEYGHRHGSLEAIKMEDPPLAWEFYILRTAKRRLGVSRASESIINAYEMHVYPDEGFLVEEYRNQGTLLDLVNLCRAENGAGMEEMLVMFFTVEILRAVEALHSKGIIHGDLKVDNILVRFDSPSTNLGSSTSSDSAWSAQYCRHGRNGWNAKGITLIDFGRGIDMKAFEPDVQFIADWRTSEADCAEMREMRPWTYQVDYHGLAGIIHSLLFGKYLETIAERGGTLGAGATKTYKIREGLKRYWQQEIWSECFDTLLNAGRCVEGEEGKKLPLLQGMKALRVRMEEYLEGNCEKGTGLKGMIRRLENSIKERRK